MDKAQKIIAVFLIGSILIIAALLGVYFYKLKNSDNSNELILYYSLTCPHCKIVEEFMDENNITSKLNIIQKEVSSDILNANELVAAGTNCNIAKTYIGAVPLLYYQKKCYVGDKEIIELLKNKTGVN